MNAPARADKKNDKKRIFWMDAFRVFAMYPIIAHHGFQLSPSACDGVEMAVVAWFANAVLGCFFLISGALLLPVKGSARDFYRKRMSKMLPALLLWSLIYIVERYCHGIIGAHTAIMDTLLIPLQPAEGVLWFLYAIIAIYVIMPFLSVIVRNVSVRMVEGLIVVWLLSCSMPFFDGYIRDYYVTKTVMFHFYNALGFPLLGWWLINHRERLRAKSVRIVGAAAFVILGVALPLWACIGKTLSESIDIFIVDYGVNVELYAVASWLFFAWLFSERHRFPRWFKAAVSEVARYSMGIYLVQIIVIREIALPLMPSLYSAQPWVVIVVGGLVSYLLCYAVIKAISYIPGSRYLTGAH